MVTFTCPRCQRIYNLPDHLGDFVCNCSESEASDVLKYDDIEVIGSWSDWTGSKTLPAHINWTRGHENIIQGQRAKVEGERELKRTKRGNIKAFTRKREHQEYIVLDKE